MPWKGKEKGELKVNERTGGVGGQHGPLPILSPLSRQRKPVATGSFVSRQGT